jgi:hypothetical protein
VRIGVFDLSHLFHRCVYATADDLRSNGFSDFGLLRHMMLNAVIKTKIALQLDEVVLACDSSPSWRVEVYPLYKAGRKAAKDASEIDWERVAPFLASFINDVRTFFPWKVVKVDGLEGDDIIAAISLRFGEEDPEFGKERTEVYIIGSDKDFFQLHGLGGVRQYDPIKEEMIKCDDAPAALMEKVLCGEDKAGDGYGNVLMSVDDCRKWIESDPGYKKPPFGPKKAAKVMEEGVDNWLRKQPPEVTENFNRNFALASFSRTPVVLMVAALAAYRESPTPKDGTALLIYLAEHRLNTLTDLVSQI